MGFLRDTQQSRVYDAEETLLERRVSKHALRHLVDTQRASNLTVPDPSWTLPPEEEWAVYRRPDGTQERLKPLHPQIPAKIPTVAAVQDYVDAVTSTAWFIRRWGTMRITVVAGRGSHANVGRRITISQRHRRSESVILHEMAHVLAPWYDVAPHGPEFAATFLTLVDGIMGKEHGRDLRVSYAEHLVKYRSGLTCVPKPSADRWAWHQQWQAAKR